MMKIRFPLLQIVAFFVGIMGPAYPAFASNQSGTVTLIAWADGRFFFSLNGARTGTVPSCSCCNRWEVKSNTDGGRALIAMILSAQGTGKSVTVLGSGSCVADTNDTEGVTYGEVLS